MLPLVSILIFTLLIGIIFGVTAQQRALGLHPIKDPEETKEALDLLREIIKYDEDIIANLTEMVDWLNYRGS